MTTEPKSIAFKERESADPNTGAYGILRDEWRIIPYEDGNSTHMRLARTLHYLTIVLEHRYIRRGKIEPWTIVDGYTSETDALSDIDHKAIAIDCPALVWVQHDRIKARREHEAELERKRVEADQLAEEVYQRSLRRKAWEKMYHSSRYRPLCDEWNEFASNPRAKALRSLLKTDREFVRLYDFAIKSNTVPSKRLAIRACLDYYNFMWKHREPKTLEE